MVAFLALTILAVIVENHGCGKVLKDQNIFSVKTLQEFHPRNVASMWQLLDGGEPAAMAVRRRRQTVLGKLAIHSYHNIVGRHNEEVKRKKPGFKGSSLIISKQPQRKWWAQLQLQAFLTSILTIFVLRLYSRGHLRAKRLVFD